MRLAFLINAHQTKVNRKCTCIPGAVYTSTPADLPDPPFRFFEGLDPTLKLTCMGLESHRHHHMQFRKLLQSVGSHFFLLKCHPKCSPKLTKQQQLSTLWLYSYSLEKQASFEQFRDQNLTGRSFCHCRQTFSSGQRNMHRRLGLDCSISPSA